MTLHLKMLLTGIYLCFAAEQTMFCSQSLSNVAETKSLVDNWTMDEISQHSDLVLDDASSHSWGTSALVAVGLGLAAVGAGLGLAYYNSPKTSKIIESPKTSELIQVYSDGIRIIDLLSYQNQILSRSVINSSGVTTTLDGMLLTAWHEAGHAVGLICNQSLSKVTFMTNVTDLSQKNLGHGLVLNEKVFLGGHTALHDIGLVAKTIEELENEGIGFLCGGIADQVAMSQPMFIESSDILKFFGNVRYGADLPHACHVAQIILTRKPPRLTQAQMAGAINQTLVDWYKKGYAFVIENKAAIQKLAHVLVEKQKLAGHEVYNILDADMPLLDFEEGPLPKSLITDYQLRGWPEHDTVPRASLYEKGSLLIDLRRDESSVAVDGVKTVHRYYLAGQKAVEIVTHPDGSQVEIGYFDGKKHTEVHRTLDGNERIIICDSHEIPEVELQITAMGN